MRKFKYYYQNKLDEEAEKEAAENRLLPPGVFEARLEEEKKLREKKDLRFVGFLMILFSGFILYGFTSGVFKKIVDVSSISGDDFTVNSRYYIDKLFIIDTYSKFGKNDYTFYLAAFKDKNDKLWFISFDPLEKSKARKIIDEYSEENDFCNLSVYVDTSNVAQDRNSKYSTIYLNRENYYYEVSGFYEKYINAKTKPIHAKYICMKGENVRFVKIRSLGWSGTIIISIFALIFLAGLRLILRQ